MIRAAIIPVAGLGTRLLPATKSQPKEMLPVARKPIVQYVFEELANNGIDQMLFITGRGKTSIENHFDTDPELARALNAGQRNELMKEIDFTGHGARIAYTRQPVQRGLGDAVLCGEKFIDGQPFIVALGDSVLGLHGQSKTISRMARVFEAYGADCVIAVREVPLEDASKYGILEATPGEEEDVLVVRDIVEKPERPPTTLAVAGRYAFSPLIFDRIRQVQPDKRGEIQLTDAIRLLCKEGKRVLAVRLPPGELRYDIGNFKSYFTTFAAFALADKEYGESFRKELEQMLAAQRAQADENAAESAAKRS